MEIGIWLLVIIIMWSQNEINSHKKSAKSLAKIMNLAFCFIGENKNITEYKVQQFILKKFKEFNLSPDYRLPIVAFGKNASDPHYTPTEKKSKKPRKNNLIMIDIWTNLRGVHSPFADITWMGYFGNEVNPKTRIIYDIVIKARDTGIKFIEKELKNKKMPLGKDIDMAVRNIIEASGFGKNFIHRTGHSIGYTSPHGRHRGLSRHNPNPLLANYGYTIEPGIYLKNQLGARSEINFYITTSYKLVITTPMQRALIIIP